MIKIIQIAISYDGQIHGIDNNGNLYYWGRNTVRHEKPDEDGDKYHYIYGWKLLKDEINSKSNNNVCLTCNSTGWVGVNEKCLNCNPKGIHNK